MNVTQEGGGQSCQTFANTLPLKVELAFWLGTPKIMIRRSDLPPTLPGSKNGSVRMVSVNLTGPDCGF